MASKKSFVAVQQDGSMNAPADAELTMNVALEPSTQPEHALVLAGRIGKELPNDKCADAHTLSRARTFGHPRRGNFVAGFRDERGERRGSLVPLSREIVERLILTSTEFTPVIDIDGTVQAWPGGLGVDDDTFTEMLKLGLLHKIALDDLVAQAIALAKNEPNAGRDGVILKYMTMRNSLLRALQLVNDEISRRSGKGGER